MKKGAAAEPRKLKAEALPDAAAKSSSRQRYLVRAGYDTEPRAVAIAAPAIIRGWSS